MRFSSTAVTKNQRIARKRERNYSNQYKIVLCFIKSVTDNTDKKRSKLDCAFHDFRLFLRKNYGYLLMRDRVMLITTIITWSRSSSNDFA